MKKLTITTIILVLIISLMSCGTMKVVNRGDYHNRHGLQLWEIEGVTFGVNPDNTTYYINYTKDQVIEELHLRRLGIVRNAELRAKSMLLNPNTGEYYKYRIAVDDTYAVAYYDFQDKKFHCELYTLDEDYILEKAKVEGKIK